MLKIITILGCSKVASITPQVPMAVESPSILMAATTMAIPRAILMANTSVDLEVTLMATILTSKIIALLTRVNVSHLKFLS